jgi:hypothetical protein
VTVVLAVGARFSGQASLSTRRQVHVRHFGQARFRLAGHGDHGHAHALDGRDDHGQFAALAGIGNGDQHVLRRDHAEVAVGGFGRVQEQGRGTGRGQGRRDLAADVARLADARDDHAALARHHQRDGARDAVVLAQARGEFANRFALDIQGFPGQIQCALRLGLVKTCQHYFFIGYTHTQSISELRKQETCQLKQTIS